MPGADYSQPLAQASGGAATDWGSVEGAGEVSLKAEAQLSRGFNLDLGVMGMASIDAALSKFLTAEVTGEAHAAASLRAQVQVPMNLFKEIGLAVRLEAIAELAAGVQASLGISVGDFVALVEQSPGMQGLPAALFRVFLEEVTLSVGVYAKAALSAQAFTHLVLTGTAIGDPVRGTRPGFNVVASMGAGLKAGAGFRVFARFGIDDFRRLFGRSVDLLVDDAVAAARPLVQGDANAETRRLLEAARAPVKIGLRLAYDLGEVLAKSAPARDAAGGQAVALRAGQVILEESQRFLLESFGELAVRQLRDFLATRRSSPQWNAAAAQRQALADVVRGRPVRPFDGSAVSQAFWAALVARSIDVATALSGADDPTFVRGASLAWAASTLVTAASARVVDVQARASVIGVAPLQQQASFTGALASQPPPVVDASIRSRLTAIGQTRNGALRFEDLAAFLGDAALLDLLRGSVPGVDDYLAPFAAGLGAGASAAAKILLQNAGALAMGGAMDNRQTLMVLTGALRTLYADQIESRLLPPLRQHLAVRADALLVFDEVLVPSLRFAVDTVFDQALRWNVDATPADQLTEALSGVVMRVLGRSLVASTDVLLAAAQAEMGHILNETADEIDRPGGLTQALLAQLPAGTAAEDVADLVAEGLRVAADVFGPLSDTRRATIRRLLYQIIDMLPPDADQAFLAELARGDFMPRTEPMQELAGELATVAIERFLLFVERFLLRLAEKLLEELIEFFQNAAEAVAAWANDVIAGLQVLAETLAQLVADIAKLIDEVAVLLADAGERVIESLEALRSGAGRTAFKNGLFDATIGAALDELDANAIAAGLMAVVGRSRVESCLRSAFKGALDNEIVDWVLDAIGDAASTLDDLVDDVRALNPDLALAPQLATLVLDRIEETVVSIFGGDAVDVPLRFTVTWQEYDLFAQRWRTKSQTIDLGHVRVGLDPLLDVVRAVADGFGALQDAIDAAATAFAAGFEKERQLGDKQTEQAVVEQEQATLSAHADEARTVGRAVSILAPTPAQVIDRPSRIVIDLAGALPSMLASGADVPQRVFVQLNDENVPLDSFTIEQSGRATLRDVLIGFDPGALGPGGLTGMPPLHGAGSPAGLGFARGLSLGLDAANRRRGSGAAGTPPSVRLRGRSPQRSFAPQTMRIVGSSGQAQSVRRFGVDVTGRRGTGDTIPGVGMYAGSGRAGGVVRDAGFADRSDRGRNIGNPTDRAIFVDGGFGRGLGKGLPPSIDPGPPIEGVGLRLTKTLLPGDLVAGINTLMVALVAPSGEPLRNCVTFFAQPASSAAPAPAPPDTRRPGRDGKVKPMPARRIHDPGLLEAVEPGRAALPKGKLDAAALTPKPSRGTLPLKPKSVRTKAAADLATAIKSKKVDPLRRAKAASPLVAAQAPRAVPKIYAPPTLKIAPRPATKARAPIGVATGPGSVFTAPAPESLAPAPPQPPRPPRPRSAS